MSTFFERHGDALIIWALVLLAIANGALTGGWQSAGFLGVAIINLMRQQRARLKALEAEIATLRGSISPAAV